MPKKKSTPKPKAKPLNAGTEWGSWRTKKKSTPKPKAKPLPPPEVTPKVDLRAAEEWAERMRLAEERAKAEAMKNAYIRQLQELDEKERRREEETRTTRSLLSLKQQELHNLHTLVELKKDELRDLLIKLGRSPLELDRLAPPFAPHIPYHHP
jgi:hypothetical protein